MEAEIGIGIFAELGNKMDSISSKLDYANRCKPIHYAVSGSAVAPAGAASELDIASDDYPSAGRIWRIRSVAIQGVPGNLTQSVQNTGSVTSPGAGATIVQTGTVGPGIYTVTVTAWLDGTVAAADQNNMVLTPGSFTLPVVPVINVPVTQTIQISAVSTSFRFVVKSVAAGTAGAIYNASISATQISNNSSADVFCGQNILAPDIGSQIAFAQNFPVPGIQYFPDKAVHSHYGNTIFARVYNVPGGSNVSLVAQVADYPIDAIEALSV